MSIIDAHCHYWQLSRGDYGWLNGAGAEFDPIQRDFLPADYPADAGQIAVQAAPSVAETDFLLDLARDNARILGVVGWVDLSARDAVAYLERLAGDPSFRGVRPMLQDIDETEWLLEAARPEALQALQRLDLRFDALVTARHLPMLQVFAARNPDLPLIIDHAAKPQPGPRADWEDGLKALARLPHVHCKLSGLLTELSPAERADPLPALRRAAAALLDWFGPERLVWGSDWPVLTLAGTWQEWRSLTDTLLADLGAAEKDAILGGNAGRFYGVTP